MEEWDSPVKMVKQKMPFRFDVSSMKHVAPEAQKQAFRTKEKQARPENSHLVIVEGPKCRSTDFQRGSGKFTVYR